MRVSSQRIVDCEVGSKAAPPHDISTTAALGGNIADLKNAENHNFEGPVSGAGAAIAVTQLPTYSLLDQHASTC